MHLRLRQFGAACVLALAISSTAHAQQDDEKTPLGKKMSAMNAAFKAVGRQIDDASKNASTLEQLAVHPHTHLIASLAELVHLVAPAGQTIPTRLQNA